MSVVKSVDVAAAGVVVVVATVIIRVKTIFTGYAFLHDYKKNYKNQENSLKCPWVINYLDILK